MTVSTGPQFPKCPRYVDCIRLKLTVVASGRSGVDIHSRQSAPAEVHAALCTAFGAWAADTKGPQHLLYLLQHRGVISGLAGLQDSDLDVAKQLHQLQTSGVADVLLATLTVVESREKECAGYDAEWGYSIRLTDWITADGEPAAVCMTELYNCNTFLQGPPQRCPDFAWDIVVQPTKKDPQGKWQYSRSALIFWPATGPFRAMNLHDCDLTAAQPDALEGGAEHGDIVEAAARGLLGKLEGLAQVAHWEDWAGAPCGPDCRHPELAQMQPQDAAVAALLSALQALAGSRPAAALAAAQELLGGCLAAFLRPAHVAPLLAACGRLGWWPLRSHLVLLLEKCAWSADYRLPFQLLVDLASAQQGAAELRRGFIMQLAGLLSEALKQGRDCWRKAILRDRAAVDLFLSIHVSVGSSALLLQFVDFVCGDGKDGNCAAIAADTDRLCQACVRFSQLPEGRLSTEGRLAVARFVSRCMERLFCDAWRYAPTAERKQWTFARASPLACGCSDCIARLVALTDSAEQQQTVRQMASQICAMSRPRKAMMARAVRQLLECHDIFVSSVTGFVRQRASSSRGESNGMKDAARHAACSKQRRA